MSGDGLVSTWRLRISNGNGGWGWYGQIEHDTEIEAYAFADRVFDDGVPYQVVRVDRTVVAEVAR